MLEIIKDKDIFKIKDSNWVFTTIDFLKKEIKIDYYLLDMPWEYEKSLILWEVKSYQEKMFYSLIIESFKVFVIFDDNFDLKEEIVSFFWDIDILIINTSKNSQTITENIEAKTIIPFWEYKDIYLNSLWQHKEELNSFKIKTKEQFTDTTTYINLI